MSIQKDEPQISQLPFSRCIVYIALVARDKLALSLSLLS